jgi:hypothetical protein
MAEFLILVRPLPGQTPQPHIPGRVEKWVDMHDASQEWAKASKAKGHSIHVHGVAPNQSNIVGAATVQAGSAEEVLQEAHSFPMAPYFQFEVLSLVDFDSHMESIKERVPQHFEKV